LWDQLVRPILTRLIGLVDDRDPGSCSDRATGVDPAMTMMISLLVASGVGLILTVVASP